MKKLLTLALILTLALSAVGCSGKKSPSDTQNTSDKNAAAQTTTAPTPDVPGPSASDFQYEVSGDGIAITRYTGTATEVVIPDTIDGKAVVSIGEGAFAENQTLVSVKTPNTLVFLGIGAFRDCPALESVELNDGLITVSSGIINQTKVKEITIPKTVTDIQEVAFANCPALEKVTFEGNAPEGYVLDGVQYGLYAARYTVYFHPNATGFTSPLWNGYKSQPIGQESGIHEESDFVYVQSEDGGVTVMGYKGDQTDVVIPETLGQQKVTGIGDLAFAGLVGIVSVEIPDTVTSIGRQAFSDCVQLTKVDLPESLANIGTGGFWGCTKLAQITFPDTLTHIGNEAFSNCSGLKAVQIPKSVTDLGNGAFFNAGLESVEFEGGLETVGDFVFAGTKIREITLPASVRAFNVSAFLGCTELESVRFEGNAPSLEGDPVNESDENDYTVYYHEDAEGFTSPEWNGHPSAIW